MKGENARILVVEDDETLRDIMGVLLRMLGYEVCGVVPTAEEAIALAVEKRPDLALVDVNLSGRMDGIALAPFLLDVLDIPVVFMSGGIAPERMAEAVATGAVAFQEKPFSKDDLHRTIEVGLATHAIRRRVQGGNGGEVAVPTMEAPFFITDCEGRVLYRSPAARERNAGGNSDPARRISLLSRQGRQIGFVVEIARGEDRGENPGRNPFATGETVCTGIPIDVSMGTRPAP